MYCVLLVSSDRELCFLGIRFSPMLDPDITLRTAEDIPQAINIMKSLPVDAVVFDQDEVNDISKFIVATDRNRVTAPVILVSKNPTMDLLREAIDLRIDGFIPRSGRDPSDFFGEVNMRASIIAERRRNENYRRINESRMEALVKMASMGEEDFQTIVRYALEKSVELTHSKIGYVALYERERGMLNMLAWSSQAMKGCEVSNYPVEFELNSKGIWGEPIRLGKSITINDYENDRKSMKKGTPAGHVKLEKLLMVPIIVDGEIIGTAGVGNKDSEYTTFDETQLNLMMTELFSIYKSRETFRHEITRSNAARTLMESGPVGFMYIDSDMNIIFSNRVAADIIGCVEQRQCHSIAADEQIAQMVIESTYELPRVKPFLYDIIEQQQYLRHVMLLHFIHYVEIMVIVDDIQIGKCCGIGHPPTAVAGHLVKDRKGVTHATIRLARDEIECLLLDFYTL